MSRNLPKIVVVTVLMAVFLYFFGRSVDWKKVPAQIANVNLPVFLLLIPGVALHFFTRALRWRVLVGPEKKDVRFGNLVVANIVGFTVSYVLPGRLGELAKPLYLARKEGLRPGFTVGTVVVERIFDMSTMCLLLGLFLLARPLFAGSWPISPEAGEKLTLWGTVGIGVASKSAGAAVGRAFGPLAAQPARLPTQAATTHPHARTRCTPILPTP